jgi:Putative polyhydroxyalkanoic acid system protein (PHA_gran_rgn)
MYVSSSPAVGTYCAALHPEKRTADGKVPILKQQKQKGVFFSKNVELHELASLRIFGMSAPLIVSIPHRLGREEATRRLKAGLTRAATSVPVLKVDEERWEDNRMIFRVRALGQAASGHLDVDDNHVRLEVTLPWLLQRFAEVAQAAIKNRGNLLLTKKS